MSDDAPGLHLVLAEPDYLDGVGPLALRIDRIDRSRVVRYDGDLWYRVAGVEIGYNGAEIRRREVHVRAGRLPSPTDASGG